MSTWWRPISRASPSAGPTRPRRSGEGSFRIRARPRQVGRQGDDIGFSYERFCHASDLSVNHAAIQVDARLRERANWGDLHGQSLAEFVAMWERSTADPHFVPPRGIPCGRQGHGWRPSSARSRRRSPQRVSRDRGSRDARWAHHGLSRQHVLRGPAGSVPPGVSGPPEPTRRRVLPHARGLCRSRLHAEDLRDYVPPSGRHALSLAIAVATPNGSGPIDLPLNINHSAIFSGLFQQARLIAELRQYAQEGADKPMRLHALERIFRRDFCVAPILLLWYTARAWPNVHMNAPSELARAISSATSLGGLPC